MHVWPVWGSCDAAPATFANVGFSAGPVNDQSQVSASVSELTKRPSAVSSASFRAISSGLNFISAARRLLARQNSGQCNLSRARFVRGGNRAQCGDFHDFALPQLDTDLAREQ